MSSDRTTIAASPPQHRSLTSRIDVLLKSLRASWNLSFHACGEARKQAEPLLVRFLFSSFAPYLP